jgi:hypothetical protein
MSVVLSHSKTQELVEIRIDPIHFEDISIYDDDVTPLKVTMEYRTYHDNKSTFAYMYMLPAPSTPPGNLDKYAHYPLVLVKATTKIRIVLTEWLKDTYLASFKSLFIPSLCMKDMLGIWVDSIHNLPGADSFEYGKLFFFFYSTLTLG